MDKNLLKNEDKLLDALANGGGLDVDGLTDAERQIVSRMLRELRESGDSTTLDKLYEIDYERRPPTIQEFIEDEYYLGSVTKGDPEEDIPGLFPKWREVLYRDFAPGNTIQQAIFTGSIGLGKSFVGSIIVLYKAAHALCLRDPLGFYGLNKATSLVFSFFSVTQKQVKGGTFKDCTNIMGESPFFKERIVGVDHKKYADRRVELQKNIIIEAGSKLHEALGRNSIVTLIDEINFRLEKDAAKSAFDLVEGIKRRAVSRFQKDKTNPYLMIIISSTKEENDFLTGYINQMRHSPNVRVYEFPWWEVTGAVRMKYSGEKFRVDIGDNVSPPRFLDAGEFCAPDRLLEVPVEHRPEFEQDLPGYIRDIGGRAVGRTSKFFYDLLPLYNCSRDELINPMATEEIPLSIGVDHEIRKFVDIDKIIVRRGAQMIPKISSFSPRFIHMDMSMGGDAFGFCMLHATHTTQIGEFNPITARRESVTKPCFQIDFLFRLVRAHGSKEVLDFSKIREFIWWLKDYCHYSIETISADLRALSVPVLQPLQQAGLDTKYLSVDKTKEAYEGLRQAVMEGRLKMFDHEWFFLEAIHLENLPKMIDHPAKFPMVQVNGKWLRDLKGSKDCADAVAGAVALATSSETGLNLNTSKAAQHFFKEFSAQNPNQNPDSWLVQDAQPSTTRII